MSFDPDKLMAVLHGLPAAQRYWVAFSGGLDSTVLLHALAMQRDILPGELRGVHVNHHINPKSDDWQRHCVQACTVLHLALECRHVEIRPAKGESLEAAARDRRHEVFRALMRTGDALLLAHHKDDQLETFLLQAMRGAGLRGLAAMPAMTNFAQGFMLRPLLSFTRHELQAWAQQQALTWLEDPSNADTRFDRNYLRHQITPLIRRRWPSAAETVARSARHCGEALELLAAVAEEDRLRYISADAAALPMGALQQLPLPRAKNLLRHWLERQDLPLPAAHKLEQIFTDLLPARADRNPCIQWEGVEVRRYRQHLYALPPLPEPAQEFLLQPDAIHNLSPGLGSLRLVAATGEGLRLAACPPQGLWVRFRSGGEVCQPAGRDHHRPLKKWLQELGVLPWMRERLPLLYAGGELAAVAGLFVCAAFASGEHEAGLRIEWQAHPRLQ